MQVVLWLLAPGHEDFFRAADFSFQPNGSYGLRSEDYGSEFRASRIRDHQGALRPGGSCTDRNGPAVDIDECLIVLLRTVAGFIFGSAFLPHRQRLAYMRPSPLHLLGQILRVARAKKNSRAAMVHKFLHAAQGGRDHRNTAGIGFQDREWTLFITFAGIDQESRASQDRQGVPVRHLPAKGHRGKPALGRFFVQLGAKIAIAHNEKRQWRVDGPPSSPQEPERKNKTLKSSHGYNSDAALFL